MSSNSRVTWRLLVVMAERGIRTATDLQRRLQAVGIDISSAQLSRVVGTKPQRLSLDLLEGLMTVLDCDANALLGSQDEGQSTRHRAGELPAERAPPKPTTGRRPRNRRKGVVQGDVAGPKVAPFPIAKRKG